MKIFIKGCFQPLPYELVKHLINQDIEVFGQDHYEEDDEKFERFAKIGRHASFHLYDSKEPLRADCYYDFTIDNLLCEFYKLEDQIIKVHDSDYNRKQNGEQLIDEKIIFLASLKDYSQFPDHIKLNGEGECSIHLIK
ncbi:hypothetical protein E3U55_06920 [Filobacillus milosensis]|uniref:Uncharacterized protein n=1 Tax=Filobacillus milosensis TaxID=94137 RepID=A0A4Y8IQ25_9BACI|nr:hypothetical protein [Filobacillus milosensis]TFB22026.1 hypothetical protein E3U55_06920 [Filobacillus milosensis]